jgi:hypothetical protein
LRRCVERGSDARPALVGLHRPAVVRPCLRDACYCSRLGYPRRVTVDHDVRVADRYRDRTPRIARDVAPLRVRAPVWNQNVPSTQRAPTAVTCGLPASLTVDSHVVREFAASGRGVDPASSFSTTAAQSTGGSPSALPRFMVSISQNLSALFAAVRCRRSANWQRAAGSMLVPSSAGPALLWRARRGWRGWVTGGSTRRR